MFQVVLIFEKGLLFRSLDEVYDSGVMLTFRIYKYEIFLTSFDRLRVILLFGLLHLLGNFLVKLDEVLYYVFKPEYPNLLFGLPQNKLGKGRHKFKN